MEQRCAECDCGSGPCNWIAKPIDPDARVYPCADCGKMRSKREGGTTFTVCDECWDKHFSKEGPEAAAWDALHS